MKIILFLLCSFPVLVMAQECKVKKEVDPYSKEVKLTTGFKAFGGGANRTSVSADASKTDVEFILSVNNGAEGKCFDNTSAAIFVYEGGRQKGNFKNNSSMNCEGLFSISFRNVATTPTTLKNLATKKVISIKLTGNAKQVTEITLTEAEQQTLLKMAACIIEESKTLLVKV
ncbi:MAG TPA: hypothetical protein VEY06_08395 [Flavisolibacter sp.]|nr:hypothetical protein [Flavisolibacter sp.]